MLDIGFIEQVIFDFTVAGGIEDFFLDGGVDGQFRTDLLHQVALGGSLGAFSNFSNSSSTLR